MKTQFENIIRLNVQRLTALKNTIAELERDLSDAGVPFEPEPVRSALGDDLAMGHVEETWDRAVRGAGQPRGTGARSGRYPPPYRAGDHDTPTSAAPPPADERTALLVNNGRRSVYHPRPSPGTRKAAAVAVLVTSLVVIVAVTFRGGAAWPPSVATVQNEIAKACRNPDVKSDPGQVNFACGNSTRQILWVFSLITSANNPDFADTRSGRIGLEPITPAQGGEVASSLNLYHPYDPTDPIDSLEVAARAINNIIGGATVTGANGKPVVQPGLESYPSNCARYTGSAAVVSRAGFPNLCAAPLTSTAGQAALVADVYRKWVVGAPQQTAHDAAVLFENASNPGDSSVQAILKHLPGRALAD